VAERLGLERMLQKVWRPIRHIYLLLAVMLGWVFFRAATPLAALHFFQTLLGLSSGAVAPAVAYYLNTELLLALCAGALGATPVIPLIGRMWDRVLQSPAGRGLWTGSLLQGAGALAEAAACMALLFASTALLAVGTYNPFIYFRF
jgi:alginate O-acetyltransferase complex protein AlgI